ncbi:aquaporin AQPAe.a-like isoform X4 [Linepithema humile]|uniref:aquaporin AQPAe.a-like isoform X4 n=1 Tax=Linepithema humile TaxID=83485 RepID=UPI00351DB4EE
MHNVEDAEKYDDNVRGRDCRYRCSRILRLYGVHWCHGACTTSSTADSINLWLDGESHNYGHVSGAHVNPAVTIGAVIIGLKSIPTGVIYILGQFIGATIGYGILKMITPAELFNDGNLNSTAGVCVTVVHPGISSLQGVLIEVFCTSCLLCAACATWDSRCAHTTDSTALKFGLSVATISFAASPYTGCSMNPARSFGPAIWNSAWKDQWIYWLGPIMGALLGTYAYQVLFAEKQPKTRKSICLTDEKSFDILLQLDKACNI